MEKKTLELLTHLVSNPSLRVGDSFVTTPEFKALDAHITDMLTEATQRGVQAERERWKGRMNAVYGKCADGEEVEVIADKIEAAIRAKVVKELRSSAFLHCDVNKEHVLLAIEHGARWVDHLPDDHPLKVGDYATDRKEPIPHLFPGTPKLTCNPFPTGHAAVNVKPEYVSLLGVLCEALDQAQHGKGAERHNLGGDAPFERQRMQTVSELVGSPEGMVYQAIKKLTEGMNLPTLDRQVKELLGAINYIAGIVLFLRKRGIEAACKPLEKWSKPCRWQAPDDKSAAEPMSDGARTIKVEIDAGTLHVLKQKARRYDEAVSGGNEERRPVV